LLMTHPFYSAANLQELAALHLDLVRGLFLPVQGQHQKAGLLQAMY
jgi:hypothetical protein